MKGNKMIKNTIKKSKFKHGNSKFTTYEKDVNLKSGTTLSFNVKDEVGNRIEFSIRNIEGRISTSFTKWKRDKSKTKTNKKSLDGYNLLSVDRWTSSEVDIWEKKSK